MEARTLYEKIWDDLSSSKRMIFMAGPRQSGKTTLSNHISELFVNALYFNWDIQEHRRDFIDNPTFFESLARKDESIPLVVFDEIHKYKDWKNYLKGIYDGFSKDYQANEDELAGFYLIYSMKTLGINENDLESQMHQLVNQTVDYELKMRGLALVNRKEFIEDKSWRAYGLLKTARIISGTETLKLLSDLRLAASLNILNDIDPKLILRLLFQTQTGHLLELRENNLKSQDIQKIRAEFIRDELQKN